MRNAIKQPTVSQAPHAVTTRRIKPKVADPNAGITVVLLATNTRLTTGDEFNGMVFRGVANPATDMVYIGVPKDNDYLTAIKAAKIGLRINISR